MHIIVTIKKKQETQFKSPGFPSASPDIHGIFLANH